MMVLPVEVVLTVEYFIDGLTKAAVLWKHAEASEENAAILVSMIRRCLICMLVMQWAVISILADYALVAGFHLGALVGPSGQRHWTEGECLCPARKKRA